MLSKKERKESYVEILDIGTEYLNVRSEPGISNKVFITVLVEVKHIYYLKKAVIG